ncbi:MAG: D-2-hydroxyacid dehydrogenase [Proteobacteria bacterium]|nr:D-2-hydroxyacid dehydrogenase [Pseudomonadota bacterium]
MERVVFLDRASLDATLRPPRFAHTWQDHARTAETDVVARLAGATIAVTNKIPLREAALAKLPDLKLIAVAATGTDCVDVAAAKARGVVVSNIRNYALSTLPEHVFMLMLALRRNLLAYRADVAAGKWQQATAFCLLDHPVHDLAGSTLGVIGLGALGARVAQIGRAFGMRVLGHDPQAAPGEGVTPAGVAEILREADVVTLHLPLTPATRNMIGAAELATMKPTALLINTARGGLVDEAALAAALRARKLGGAGFDVLTKEPPVTDNPLLQLDLPNFILTPHVAWASREAMQGLADQLVENIELFVAGTPRHVL